MKLTTLCYVERDEKYLMLHRVVKEYDVNRDKWIGIGGKFEKGESPEDCLLREAWEETGYRLTRFRMRGIVTFLFNDIEEEYMFLYTASGFTGTLRECPEGVLEWVGKDEIGRLNLWEGDRIFFELLRTGAPFFSLKLSYHDDRLMEAVLDGKALELLDVLDGAGEPSGAARERTLVHRYGDYHRTSHVWIARKADSGVWQLLLQKRSRDKDSFPGCYDISSAGHIPAGMDYLESAVRELHEELGILAGPDDLRQIGFHDGRFDGEFYGEPFKNHEKSAVFLYLKPVDEKSLTLQRSEVESVRWMNVDEILREVGGENPDFCLYLDEVEFVKNYLESCGELDDE